MTIPKAFLPLDLTGSAVANLVNDEYQQITGGARSIIRPDYGAYYKNSLRLYTVSGDNRLGLLNYGADYICSGFDPVATINSGQDVYSSIIILDPNLTSIFSLTYQAYGGIDNINKPGLNTLAQLAGLGTQTPWSLLYNVPTQFNPTVGHKHDISDVYGMEVFVNYLSDIQSEIIANQTNAKYVSVTAALQDYIAAQEAAISGTAIGIRNHIDLIDHPHDYTASQLGLGNLMNYSFSYTLVNGIPTKAYAGPDTIGYYLANRPGYQTNNHSYLQTNPHGDTAIELGLGKLVNYAMTSTYTLGTQQYSVLLASNATQVYLAPYPLVNAIDEMATVEYGTTFQQVLTNVVNSAQAVIDQANAVLTTTSGVQATLTAAVAELTTGQATATATANEAAAMDARYDLLYGNSVYAATLEQVLEYEYTNHQSNSSVTPDGYWPVPLHTSGLLLWLDPNYSGNTTFSDMNGNLRLTKLVDRSGRGLAFSADQPADAPILAMSYDKANVLTGITNANVMHFNNGYCLTQSAGEPITITPGMTIIALLRTGSAGSMLGILVNADNPTGTGIYGYTPNNQSLVVSTGDSWKPLIAPIGSTPSHTSTIVVGSISPTSEQFCWIGSSVAKLVNYPRGTDTPSNPWPNHYTGLPLTQIGIPNYAIDNEGEIGDILVFDRQLSKAEVQAIVSYLTLRYTLNTALAVDYTALNAF